MSLKALLHLVANYQPLNAENSIAAEPQNVSPVMEKLIAARLKTDSNNAVINPVYLAVDRLLQNTPAHALMRDTISDHSGRDFNFSPLELAYWLQDPLMYDLIVGHAESLPDGKEQALAQIRQLEESVYRYDVMLWATTSPVLASPAAKVPALIKQYIKEDNFKIFQWGNRNGEWQLTELKIKLEDIGLYEQLDFPAPESATPHLLRHDDDNLCQELKQKLYESSKRGHTLAHFDLSEYLDEMKILLEKYFDPSSITQWDALEKERNRQWYKVGKTQRKFPAWMAMLWCSDICFKYSFKAIQYLPLLLHLRSPRLTFASGKDFYAPGLGVDSAIYKFNSNGGHSDQAGRSNRLWIPYGYHGQEDMAVMSGLSQEMAATFANYALPKPIIMLTPDRIEITDKLKPALENQVREDFIKANIAEQYWQQLIKGSLDREFKRISLPEREDKRDAHIRSRLHYSRSTFLHMLSIMPVLRLAGLLSAENINHFLHGEKLIEKQSLEDLFSRNLLFQPILNILFKHPEPFKLCRVLVLVYDNNLLTDAIMPLLAAHADPEQLRFAVLHLIEYGFLSALYLKIVASTEKPLSTAWGIVSFSYHSGAYSEAELMQMSKAQNPKSYACAIVCLSTNPLIHKFCQEQIENFDEMLFKHPDPGSILKWHRCFSAENPAKKFFEYANWKSLTEVLELIELEKLPVENYVSDCFHCPRLKEVGKILSILIQVSSCSDFKLPEQNLKAIFKMVEHATLPEISDIVYNFQNEDEFYARINTLLDKYKLAEYQCISLQESRRQHNTLLRDARHSTLFQTPTPMTGETQSRCDVQNKPG